MFVNKGINYSPERIIGLNYANPVVSLFSHPRLTRLNLITSTEALSTLKKNSTLIRRQRCPNFQRPSETLKNDWESTTEGTCPRGEQGTLLLQVTLRNSCLKKQRKLRKCRRTTNLLSMRSSLEPKIKLKCLRMQLIDLLRSCRRKRIRSNFKNLLLRWPFKLIFLPISHLMMITKPDDPC